MMIELFFLISVAITLYHLYKILNEEFNIKLSIIFLILQLILFGFILTYTTVSFDLLASTILRFISLILIIEFLFFIVEVFVSLGYIIKKK